MFAPTFLLSTLNRSLLRARTSRYLWFDTPPTGTTNGFYRAVGMP